MSSYLSPLSVCIIIFISPQNTDLTTMFSFSCHIYEVLPLHVLGNQMHISSYLFPLYNLISPTNTIYNFLELQYYIHSECLLINPWIFPAGPLCSNSVMSNVLYLCIKRPKGYFRLIWPNLLPQLKTNSTKNVSQYLTKIFLQKCNPDWI